MHEKILEDLVFLMDIVGECMHVSVDGSKLLEVSFDVKQSSHHPLFLTGTWHLIQLH